jgi:hypothetical protein
MERSSDAIPALSGRRSIHCQIAGDMATPLVDIIRSTTFTG